MKKRKQWLMLVCIALAVCLVSGGMLYIRQKNNNKKWSLIYIPKTEDGTNDFWTSLISGTRMAAQECGAELEVLAPEREQDVEVQNKLLEEALRKIRMQYYFPLPVLMLPMNYCRRQKIRESRSHL